MAKARPLSPEEFAKAVDDVTPKPAAKGSAPAAKSPRTKTTTRRSPIGSTTKVKVDTGSSTFVFLTLATGITVVARFADPSVEYVDGKLAGGSRIVIGGVLLTGVFLVAEQFIPQFTRPLAGVVFLTALLVHGVTLGQAIANAANYTPTASPTTNPPPLTA